METKDYLLSLSKEEKYKTEICKNYEMDHFCPYGNKCRFAHGKGELKLKP